MAESESISTSTPPVGGGWHCHGCGKWIPQDILHTCNGWQNATPQWWGGITELTGQRIAAALERIAGAVEASRGPTIPTSEGGENG